MSVLESGELDFEDLICESCFVIPEYQRYYSWDEKHFTDLWEDLTDVISSKRSRSTHYMGTVICKHINNTESDREGIHKYELVDGQQRLATLIIFLKCIEEKTGDKKIQEELEVSYIKDSKDKRKVRLQDGELDDDKVLRYILQGKENIDTSAVSQRRLLEARDFFREKLSEKEDGQDFISEIFETIKSLKFMLYRIETDEKATLIFESINDRGKNLSNLDITKSFLIHRIYLNTEDQRQEKLVNQIKTGFAEIYTRIEKIKEEDLSGQIEGDQLQSLHAASYLPEDKENRKQIRKDSLQNLKSHIKTKSNSKEVRKYVEDFETFLNTYKELLNIERGKEWKHIVSGDASYFIPLAVRAKQETEDEKIFNEFLEVLEAATFRTHYREKRLDKGENTYFELSYDLRFGEKDLEQVKKEVKEKARI